MNTIAAIIASIANVMHRLMPHTHTSSISGRGNHERACRETTAANMHCFATRHVHSMQVCRLMTRCIVLMAIVESEWSTTSHVMQHTLALKP